jgi:hypothetical protein
MSNQNFDEYMSFLGGSIYYPGESNANQYQLDQFIRSRYRNIEYGTAEDIGYYQQSGDKQQEAGKPHKRF